jgi:hypothetical protein
MRWKTEESEFDSVQKQESYIFSTGSRPAAGPTMPLTQWVTGTSSPRKKRSGREVDHSLPPSTMVAYAWKYASRPLYVLIARCLIKRWNNFALTLNKQVLYEVAALGGIGSEYEILFLVWGRTRQSLWDLPDRSVPEQQGCSKLV